MNRFVGEWPRTGHPDTELIAGRGAQELLISRWDGDGGRKGVGSGRLLRDGTKCDGDSKISTALHCTALRCAALRCSLRCTVTAGTTRRWWRGSDVTSPAVPACAKCGSDGQTMAS